MTDMPGMAIMLMKVPYSSMMGKEGKSAMSPDAQAAADSRNLQGHMVGGGQLIPTAWAANFSFTVK